MAPIFSIWIPSLSIALLLSMAYASTVLPAVDLGYTPGSFYNFSNIRLVQPPLGNLRFQAPLPPTPPTPNSSTINNGSIGKICPQGSGAWHTLAQTFMINYLLGQPFDYAAAAARLPAMRSNVTDARMDEDCLFLDVYVPIYNAPYGSGVYGPVVDEGFVPELPGKLLAEGRFDKNIGVMTGHNSNEGLLFTSPLINNSDSSTQAVQVAFPDISLEALEYINFTLYPAVFDGSQGYFTYYERAKAIVADSSFVCNAKFLDWAAFLRLSGYDGQDQSFIFYNNASSTIGATSFSTLVSRQTLTDTVNTTVAFALQDYISSFVVDERPVGAGYPDIPIYGAESSVVDLSGTGIWWRRMTLLRRDADDGRRDCITDRAL
ncbi:hypothetical protein G7Y89_g5724 [Cudoniella acicularis]|uniref:Carboxylesterase type B domain-containing protein n=1 Tax=Cudoniella acicularis TaxID=354080 RepID=A0A8H4RLX5_9HELO|nr:hypothetical protein G7Y89_g5724 [Cudoniella acicularis]